MMMVVLIGIFGLCIGAEIFAARRRGLRVYDVRETIGHLAMGLGQQASNLLLLGVLTGIYVWLYENASFHQVNTRSPLNWVILVLLSDLAFYVVHRLSHRVNLLVATHDIHHQAHDFNHASALRQSWTSRVFMFFFYAPLAILGFPVQMLMASQGVNFLVQFLVHNGLIRRRLGILEYVFVTPRSHRVHHGTNHDYLDKNFGGMFIIWDRLFGTYRDLDDAVEPRIGFPGGANRYSPIVANFNYFQRLFYVARRREGWMNRIAIFFDTPEALEAELARLSYDEKYPLPGPASFRPAILISAGVLFLAGTAALTHLLRYQAELSGAAKFVWIAGILLAIRAIGWLLENPDRSWRTNVPESEAA